MHVESMYLHDAMLIGCRSIQEAFPESQSEFWPTVCSAGGEDLRVAPLDIATLQVCICSFDLYRAISCLFLMKMESCVQLSHPYRLS
jgi:hypothetical protein